MASRWVGSGIDWANLDLFEDRQSWVIDELYLAFKERDALMVQTRSGSSVSNVSAWDFSHSIRDYEKVNQMLLRMQDWFITGSFTAGQKNQAGWHDHTVVSTGVTISASNVAYRGIPYFTMAALGSFETLCGVSLAPLRDFTEPTNYRIDADLLTMIYKILINCKEIMPYNGTQFNGTPNTTAFSVMISNNTRWIGSGIDWTATKADYDAASSTNPNGLLDVFLSLNAEDDSIRHDDNYFDFINLKDSSNVVVLPSTTGLYGYKYLEGNDTYYSGYTADVFALDSLVGEKIQGYSESHPFAFTDPLAATETINSRTVLIIKVDIDTMIQYYT
tara:strand:+ start:34 stop:1029 length:996 start_codon:yes stop_codon:yes gene_type:complete